VKVWNLRQKNLQNPKADHGGIVRKLAGSCISSVVETNGFPYCPAISHASSFTIKKKKRLNDLY